MPVNTRVKLAPTTEKQGLKDLAGFAAGLQRLHTITVQKKNGVWGTSCRPLPLLIIHYQLFIIITNYQIPLPAAFGWQT